MRALVAVMMLGAACGGDQQPSVRQEPVVAVAPDAACPQVEYPRAPLEVATGDVKVTLPAIPSFELPVMPDGSRSVKELEVNGRALFDTELTVRGHVSWIYDCFTSIRALPEWADRTDKQIRKIIADDPSTYCRRPLFRITTGPTDGSDLGIKVVGVPRRPTKAEKKLLPKEELNDPAIWRPVPPLAVGDEVTVTGTWTQRSRVGESDLEGLLVYGTMTNVTQGWPKP